MSVHTRIRAARQAARTAPLLPANDADWVSAAACRTAGPDQVDWWWPISPDDPDAARAKSVCRTCSVRSDCLAYARGERIAHGIWGGLDEDERRQNMRNMAPPISEAPIRPRPRDPKPRPKPTPPRNAAPAPAPAVVPVPLSAGQAAARARARSTKAAAARAHLRALGWSRQRIAQALADLDGERS